MSTPAPFDLKSTFVVIGPQHAAAPVAVTPTLFEEPDRHHERFKGRLLVSSFAFDADWTTWEMHPAGDEIVGLLTGRVTLVLARDGGEETVHLAGTVRIGGVALAAGDYLFTSPGEEHDVVAMTDAQIFVSSQRGTPVVE